VAERCGTDISGLSARSAVASGALSRPHGPDYPATDGARKDCCVAAAGANERGWTGGVFLYGSGSFAAACCGSRQRLDM